MNKGNTNTTLLVIILLILVGFGVWWFTMRDKGGADDTNGINVNVGLPQDDSSN